MDRTTLINNIIDIPYDERYGNSSFVSLLKERGYSYYPDISTTELIAALTLKEERVEDWLQWSADKRVTEGWFFLKNNSKYTVGYSPQNEDDQQEVYNNKFEACASFILKEIQGYII